MKIKRTYIAMAAVVSMGLLAACSDSEDSVTPAESAPAVQAPAPAPAPVPAPESTPTPEPSTGDSGAVDSLKQSGQQLKEDAKEVGSAISEKAEEVKDATSEKLGAMGDAIKEGAAKADKSIQDAIGGNGTQPNKVESPAS